MDALIMNPRRLRIVLISPKGPPCRHRGGIFGRALRYKPLTLTTLAALTPPGFDVTLTPLLPPVLAPSAKAIS